MPVLAITFVLFLPALQNGFTNWDDVLYVTSNPLLKSLDADGLKAIFTTPVVSNYHPLTILSLALNYQFAELSPMSYHLTSVLLHVINTGLVFWFIWLLSSGNRWVSAIVALLFGIHPMHVESVAWISERKDLLYTLFYVAAMIAYVKYVKIRQTKYLIFATALGAVSLLCKPAAIVLPLSLLAIDYYLKREWNWSWVVEKIPMFILSGIIAYATLAIQATGKMHVTLNGADVATGGKAMTFDDATLNVGIGTVSPVANLHVDNTGTGKGGMLVRQDNEPNISASKVLSDGVINDISSFVAFGNNAFFAQRSNFAVGTIAKLNTPDAILGAGTDGNTGVQGISQSGIGVAAVSRTGTALRALISGGGPGLALLTQGGGVQFQNIGEADGYVLTSDATGNATWQGPVGIQRSGCISSYLYA